LSHKFFCFGEVLFVTYYQFYFFLFFFCLGGARFVRIFTQIKVMKVKENDFLVGGAKLGTYLSYTDVEPELMVMKPGDRVLPAPFFYEKNLWFHLIRQWAPGENRLFPNGGFEVRDGGGGVRNYDMDQVCLHPAIIKHKKTLDKMLRRAEKAQAARERAAKRGTKPPKVKVEGGRRGRPALDPAVKAARDADKVERSTRSGGKRGRPASTVVRVVSTETKPAGKRGRPSLTSEVITARASQKAATRVRTGGKRGRPKSARR
jgi:hypothetical protein